MFKSENLINYLICQLALVSGRKFNSVYSLPTDKKLLIGKPVIVNSLPWSESHGFIKKQTMGALEMYVSLARQYIKPEILVLGSGVGFIPKLFLDNSDGRVLLVDATYPDVGAGSVFDYGSYFDRYYSHLEQYKPRFIFLPLLTRTVFKMFSKLNYTFDIIFIDADHSDTGFSLDFENSLKILNPGGIIICHDTKIKHISDKIRTSGLNYIFFEIGAGFSIVKPGEYDKVEGNKWNELDLTKELKSNPDLSGSRWDYLSDPGFVARIEKYYEIFTTLVIPTPSGGIRRIIEIGGNPNPAIRYFDSPDVDALVSIEPYISDVAKSYFQSIKGNHVIMENIMQIKENYDLVIFLGADLSLTKDYDTYINEIELLHGLITNSKYVMIEHPNFSPSKLLVQTLVQGLNLIHETNLQVIPTKNFSINNDYLTRNLQIYKNDENSKLIRNHIDRDQVDIYARYFQFRGYKFRGSKVPPIQGDAQILNQFFNTWPVENSGTTDFVWLRPYQQITFPRDTTILEIDLLFPSEMLSKSRFKYRLSISSNKLIIKRRFFSKKVSIKFPFFIPSLKFGTEDQRELSFSATSFLFS